MTFNLNLIHKIDDKLPPVVIVNKGLKVNQGKNAFLTRLEFDVKDDDTASNNIYFTLLTPPKYGVLENIKEQGWSKSFF